MNRKLLIILASILIIGLLSNCSSQPASSPPVDTTPPSDDTFTPPETPEIQDGSMSDISLPSPVEGVDFFTISVEVENTGNVEADFEVRVSCEHLEIFPNDPRPKHIALAESEVFQFQGKAFYAGEPETLASLHFELYAGEELVDTAIETLWVFMPQVRFTRYKIETSDLWEAISNWNITITLTLEVKNEGRASARYVKVKATLLEENGATKYSTSEFIGYLAPLAAEQVTLTLDGDWLERYRIQIEVRDIPTGSYDRRVSEEFTLDVDFPWWEIFAFLLPYLL